MPLQIGDFFTAPVFANEPEKTRRARAAFIIGVSTLLATLFHIGLYLVAMPEIAGRIRFIIPVVVLLVCCLLILRRGSVTAASLGMLAGCWATITVLVATGGGIESPPASYYAVLVLAAGLLFGARGIVAALCVVLVTGIALVSAEAEHLLPGLLKPSLTLRTWVTFDVAVVLAMVLMNVALQDVRKALADARREVEERRRADLALRASEERFKRLSQAAFEGLMIHEDGVILDANPTFAALAGLESPADLIGKQGLDVVPFTPESRELVRKSLLAESDEPFEVELLRTDGSILPAETQGREIVYEGRRARVVGMRDIGKRKRAEAEMARRLAEVEAINKLSTALRAATAVGEVVPILIDETLALFATDVGAIWLYDPHGDQLRRVEARGWMRDTLHSPIHPPHGIGGEVFVTGRPYVVRDFRADRLTRAVVRHHTPPGWGGACFPIRSHDGVIGVFLVAVRLPREFLPSEVRLLTTLAEIAGMALHRMRLFEQTVQAATSITQAYETTLEGWVRALDLRDKETEGHTLRVTEMAMQLARKRGVAEPDLVHIRRGALLHDIGKIAISDAIVQKPGPLSEDEWEIMRRHPNYAYELLSPIEYLRPAIDIPYCHHERWNGRGYPQGLKGEEIPLSARIFAVADVWDALCSDRPYRSRTPRDEAVDYIRGSSGVHFEPRAVGEFLQLIGAA